MKAHVSRENIITFLLTTPMFENLDPVEIREILHIVETQKFGPGDVIFKEGDPGDAWYAVYKGEVEVVKESGHGGDRIRSLGEGACFGEIAVLDGSARSATIRAKSDVTVLRIPRDAFNQLIEEEHLVAFKLIKHMALMLAAQHRENTEKLARLLQAEELPHIHEGIKSIVEKRSLRD